MSMRLGKKILICSSIIFVGSLVLGAFHPKLVADSYCRDNNYKEAHAVLSKALKEPLFKNDPSMLLTNALIRRNLNDYSGARANLDEALKLQQANKLLWGSGASGKEELAFAIYKESAYLFQDQKLYEEALKETDKALKINDDSVPIHRARAKCFFSLNQADKAENELNSVVDKSTGSDLTDALVARAELFRDEHKIDLAIKDMTTVLDTDPTASSYVYRGQMYDEKGDFKSALADFDQALLKNPDYAVAIENRAEVAAKLGQK